MKILEVNNISKSLGNKKIINNVSFDLNSGKIIGFVGNNGAGKTSIFKAITGLFRIDEGSIKINGYDVTTEPFEALNHVGATIENNEFYDFLSGYDNLYIYSENKELLRKTIEFIGLKNDIFKKVKTYSLGMKARLSLGIALVNNPDLILLDEPTNGLDPSGIIELRNKLLKLKRDGKSIIISSHILSEIEKVCDEIFFIRDGTIVRNVVVSKVSESLESLYSKVESEYDEEKYLCWN